MLKVQSCWINLVWWCAVTFQWHDLSKCCTVICTISRTPNGLCSINHWTFWYHYSVYHTVEMDFMYSTTYNFWNVVSQESPSLLNHLQLGLMCMMILSQCINWRSSIATLFCATYITYDCAAATSLGVMSWYINAANIQPLKFVFEQTQWSPSILLAFMGIKHFLSIMHGMFSFEQDMCSANPQNRVENVTSKSLLFIKNNNTEYQRIRLKKLKPKNASPVVQYSSPVQCLHLEEYTWMTGQQELKVFIKKAE